jgi:hypothetical protein
MRFLPIYAIRQISLELYFLFCCLNQYFCCDNQKSESIFLCISASGNQLVIFSPPPALYSAHGSGHNARGEWNSWSTLPAVIILGFKCVALRITDFYDSDLRALDKRFATLFSFINWPFLVQWLTQRYPSCFAFLQSPNGPHCAVGFPPQ